MSSRDLDPDCAICGQPAARRCDCEGDALDRAVSQAEQKMMSQVLADIRDWVRAHAQDYILALFTQLSTRRKTQHASTVSRITERAYHYHNLPPHPSEFHVAEAELKRGIDEDWKASVQRYPEVLQYFYSLVELGLPDDDEGRVSDPPLSALGGGKGRLKLRVAGRDGHGHGHHRERRRSRVEDGRGSGRRGVQFAPEPELSFAHVRPRY